MAEKMVEVMVRIPEEVYVHLLSRYKYQDTNDIGLSNLDKVGVAIKNGTPLPKKHGRLIDADALDRKSINCANVPMNFIDIAPTIIEADKDGD